MARFRAVIQGGRGKASRCGHQEINATIDGWNLGARVFMIKKSVNGGPTEDFLEIRVTGGSNGRAGTQLVWSGTEDDFHKIRLKKGE